MNKLTKLVLFVSLSLYTVVLLVHLAYYDSHPEDLTVSPIIPEYIDLMVVFFFLYVAYVVETLCQTYNIPTPYGGFILIIGFIWGVIAYHNPVFRLAARITKMESKDIMFVYIPVIMFNLSFCVDVSIFLKALPQILMIGIPVTLATASMFGILSAFILDPTWTIKTGLFLGIFCLPHHPHSVINILKQQSTRTKQISVLLEGESLLVFFIAHMSFKLLVGKMLGLTVYWYQYVAVVMRILIVGIATGYILGVMSRYMIRRMYTTRSSLFIIGLGIPFFTYSISELYTAGCGSISVMVVGIMLGQERTVLPKNIENFLTDLWSSAAYIMDVVVCLKGAMLGAIIAIKHNQLVEFALSMVMYLMYYASRLVCFLAFSPILSRLGYGMDCKNMVVCVWGALKSPFSLEITSNFLGDIDIASKFFVYIYGLYFLSVFINGSFTVKVLDLLGLRQISLERQLNMNNCIKHIFLKRDRTIAVLKMDRFLADVNWAAVFDITNMKQPYKLGLIDDDYGELPLGYRLTYCGDCKKDIPQEPTPKELKEMIKEAKLRVLKAKKMSYSRQYENGMMTKEAMRILTQAVEIAIDSEDTEFKIEDLHKRFSEENCLVRFIRKRADALDRRKVKKVKPPRTYWRRICYHTVVRSRRFAKIMLLLVLLNMVGVVVDLTHRPSFLAPSITKSHRDVIDYLLLAEKILFALLYIAEFAMKILAYSWISVLNHGCRTYFTGFWNVLEFIFMISSIFAALISIHDVATDHYVDFKESDSSLFRRVIDVLELLRFLRLLRVFEIFYPDIIRHLDNTFDAKMALTYELGKSYTIGETEILEMLPYIIENVLIRQEVKAKAENDKLLTTKLIGLVQKERPWIAITVKTTQAIRTILHSMRHANNELKATGWVDSYEYEKLATAIDDLYKKVNSIKRVQPSPPKVIFKEVAWMAGDEAVSDFLFANVAVKSFQPGDIVFGEGNIADGIYIVVTGLLMLIYTPNDNVLDGLHQNGKLPIADYVSDFEEPAVDYIVSGNCIGELGTLTERPYNCQIRADVQSQVYIMSRSVLIRAMEMNSDPATGLECRIWKAVGVRLAVPLLLAVPAYQTLSQDLIKYALENAFVPDISRFKIFTVTEVIEDIILIEGVVADFNTRDLFTAPCWIPRTVQRLILSTSSIMELPTTVKTKLLVIPAKNVDEYDVMVLAEETCELTETASSTKCLQHTVQDRIRHQKAKTRRGILASAGWRRDRSRVDSLRAQESVYGLDPDPDRKSLASVFISEREEVLSMTGDYARHGVGSTQLGIQEK